MKMFFDTEFTGLVKDADLISIGCVLENGQKFYAELTDYDESKVDSWIKENVVDKTIFGGNKELEMKVLTNPDTIKYATCMIENLGVILTAWVSEHSEEKIQLVSDIPYYDMVLFQDIFGSALEVPDRFSRTCWDLNDNISRYLTISTEKAFDITREDLLYKVNPNLEMTITNKHNALHDAEVIFELYKKIGDK